MKILITAPSLDPAQNVSGMCSLVSLIIDHNTANRYTHFELGKRDADVRGFSWLLRTLNAYLRWAHVLLTGRHDLIHFNLAVDARGLSRDGPLILAARLLGRRLIVHLHGGAMLMDPEASPWRRLALRVIVGGRHPTIVLSDVEKQALEKVTRGDGIVVLPNCIDLGEAKRFERVHAADSPLSVLFMGRLTANKGLDHIAEAFERLKCRRDLRFIMAGTGPDEERYVSRFQQLLGDAFEFRGIVSGSQKTALLKECDVFLLPSFFEGLPMALLECMSFGLVPIATAVGSIGGVVTDRRDGLIVGIRSTDDIVNGINALADDRSLNETLSRNARRRIIDHHGPESYLARLNEIYRYE